MAILAVVVEIYQAVEGVAVIKIIKVIVEADRSNIRLYRPFFVNLGT